MDTMRKALQLFYIYLKCVLEHINLGVVYLGCNKQILDYRLRTSKTT